MMVGLVGALKLVAARAEQGTLWLIYGRLGGGKVKG
jgi:hypothetical protein